MFEQAILKYLLPFLRCLIHNSPDKPRVIPEEVCNVIFELSRCEAVRV